MTLDLAQTLQQTQLLVQTGTSMHRLFAYKYKGAVSLSAMKEEEAKMLMLMIKQQDQKKEGKKMYKKKKKEVEEMKQILCFLSWKLLTLRHLGSYVPSLQSRCWMHSLQDQDFLVIAAVIVAVTAAAVVVESQQEQVYESY